MKTLFTLCCGALVGWVVTYAWYEPKLRDATEQWQMWNEAATEMWHELNERN